MKVLLSWLRDFTPIPDDVDPDELGLVLGDLGTPVESMDRIGEGLDGIVVARVLDLRSHPDADKIQLVDVDAGDGEPLQICCGAFNMEVGDLVPLATLGTTMPNGMEIARRKLRGEWSNGMLCSPPELDLPGDPGGILVLPETLQPGVPLTEALGLEPDVLYDLEVNPNRPDAMSVAGIARDLAARLRLPFSLPEPKVTEGTTPAAELVSVDILAPERCGRFAARVLQGVTVRPSDPLIAKRLTLLGMRPINNVVDVSNYLMLELGRPSHPYDLATVAGAGFRVRRALDGEHVVTLDDVERTLTDEDLLICDGEDAPIGIAGIMGGADTEISEATTDVVVEMAWFERMPIAKSSRRLGLRSEASARFERGCDPFDIELAQDRFIELLGDAAGTPAAGMVDARGDLPDRSPIAVRPERVNAVLGSTLSPAEMKELLDPIGFTTELGAEGEPMQVALPPFRLDSDAEIDVVEEVGRMYGYSRLGKTMPVSTLSGGLTPRQRERRHLRAVLTGLGCSEASPMPFLAPGDLERAGLPGDGITITNPLVSEESVLRTSLLPGLLKAVRHNVSHRNDGIALFEIGHVFRRPTDPHAELPDEREVLGVIVAGADATEAVVIWRTICDALAVPGADVANAEMPALHPTRSACARVDGEPVGSVGEVDPDVLAAYEITGPAYARVAWLEIDLDRLLTHPHGAPTYQPVSRFPSSDIDLAFEVAEGVSATDVGSTITSAAGDLHGFVRLFDTYRGEGVREGARSLAYRVRLQAQDRTLTDDEVGTVRQRIIDEVQSVHPAVLRG